MTAPAGAPVATAHLASRFGLATASAGGPGISAFDINLEDQAEGGQVSSVQFYLKLSHPNRDQVTAWLTAGDREAVLWDGRGVLNLRTAAGGGSEVTAPAVGQTVYFTVDWLLSGASASITVPTRAVLDGTTFCTSSSSFGNGSWTTWCTSGWAATAGSHTLEWDLDYTGSIAEINETNNFSVDVFSVGSLDLVAQRAYLRTQSSGQGVEVDPPALGQAVYFTLDWQINGSGTAVSVSQRALVDGGTFCSFTLSVTPGSSWVSWCSDPWIVTSGSHTLEWDLDYTNSLAETNEGNNSAVKFFSPTGASPTLDIVSQRAYMRTDVGGGGNEVSQPTVGQTLYFYVDWQVTGTGNTVTVTQRALLDGATWCSATASAAPTSTWSSWCTSGWVATAGTHTLRWDLDYGSSVPETNESNNSSSVVFTPTGSGPTLDLVAVRAYLQSAAGRGVEVTTPNVGQTVYFYLDWQLNGSGSNVTVTERALLDGSSFCTVNNVVSPASWTSSCSQGWVVTAGTHTLEWDLDYNNTVAETSESNNTALKTFTPGGSTASFDIAAIRAYLRTAPGGGGVVVDPPANSQTVYPSLDWQVTGSSSTLTITQRAVMDGTTLCACSNISTVGFAYVSSCSQGWTPTPGTHLLTWDLDYGNTIAETNETNNSASKTFTPTGNIAQISSPAPGSTLTSTSVNFSWAAVAGASEYWLDVGTTPYVGNISGGSVGTATSKLVTGLPADASTIYATLYTKLNGSYQDSNGAYLRNSYTYTAMKVAAIASPTAGSTLSGASVTFSWAPVAGATEYWLDVGTQAFVGNISGDSVGATTSKLVTGLPVDGITIYATLYTKINGSYQDSSGAYLRNSSTYTALKLATITSPTNGSTLGTTAAFFWTSVSGANEYWLDVGTQPYVGNISGGSVGTATSKLVTGLPADGSTIYATLYTKINGSYQDSNGAYLRNSYTYSAAKIAAITSPVPGSTLGATATFTWTSVSGANEYWLDVGTAPYVGNISGGSVGLATSKLVTGLPANGSTIYVTLYTKVNGSYQDSTGSYLRNSYTFASARLAAIVSPAPGSTLSASSIVFSWLAVAGANEYWLDVGTSPYVGNIASGSVGANTSRLVTGLPLDGSTIYSTLYTKINGSYQDGTGAYLRNSYSYSTVRIAAITSPAPGTILSSSTTTFSWSAYSGGAAQYWLDVGTSPSQGNIFGGNVGSATSKQVTGLPLNGGTVFVTLYTSINGSFQDATGAYIRNSYTFTSAANTKAAVTSPAAGSALTGSTALFTWTAGAGATAYWLDVGTQAFVGNITAGNVGSATSKLVAGLPVDGSTVYATLYSYINGVWQGNSYTYTALDARAVLTNPLGSTLHGSSATFTWTTGTGVAAYWLDVGTAPGQGDISAGNLGIATSKFVSGIPTNGSTLYVNLYSNVNGVWLGKSYTYVTGP